MQEVQDIRRSCPTCYQPIEFVARGRVLCSDHGRLDYWVVYSPSLSRLYYRAALDDAPDCLHPRTTSTSKYCPDCSQTLQRRAAKSRSYATVQRRAAFHKLVPAFNCLQCGKLVEDRKAKNCKGEPKYCSPTCAIAAQRKPSPHKRGNSTAA